MGLLNLFRSGDTILKEKIIFTQKARIMSLEKEVGEHKQLTKSREDELREARANFERAKERLVDQIVDLSDKFADLNHSMVGLANELKVQLTTALNGAQLIERRQKGKKNK